MPFSFQFLIFLIASATITPAAAKAQAPSASRSSACETTYREVNFSHYDVHNLVNPSAGYGYYAMHFQNGALHSHNSVYPGTYGWFVPPTVVPYGSMAGTSPVWYREFTQFTNEWLQIAHRYIDVNGTTWELAGQPNTSVIHVYADTEQHNAPIVMQPTVNQCTKSFYSDWRSSTIPSQKPDETRTDTTGTGVYLSKRPYGKYEQRRDHAYSWANIMGRYDSMTVQVSGRSPKTYYDVVAVNWLHGAKYLGEAAYPCGEDVLSRTNGNILIFKSFLDRGYNVYSQIRWYAKERPEIGQKGGLIKSELRWYCQRNADGSYLPVGTLIGNNSVTYRRYW